MLLVCAFFFADKQKQKNLLFSVCVCVWHARAPVLATRKGHPNNEGLTSYDVKMKGFFLGSP
jgi:hypothetical protein